MPATVPSLRPLRGVSLFRPISSSGPVPRPKGWHHPWQTSLIPAPTRIASLRRSADFNLRFPIRQPDNIPESQHIPSNYDRCAEYTTLNSGRLGYLTLPHPVAPLSGTVVEELAKAALPRPQNSRQFKTRCAPGAAKHVEITQQR